jgi:hypothetical protein
MTLDQEETVIASQRVGAKRRPMTRNNPEGGKVRTGLLRRFAPRNDDDGRVKPGQDEKLAHICAPQAVNPCKNP